MIYIERDKDGKIVALRHSPDGKSTEKKSIMDEEIFQFLEKNMEVDPWVRLLSLSDIGIIRILEDLIEILIQKNIIMFTDLPEGAQVKILERKRIRQEMGDHNFMVDDII